MIRLIYRILISDSREIPVRGFTGIFVRKSLTCKNLRLDCVRTEAFLIADSINSIDIVFLNVHNKQNNILISLMQFTNI